VVVICFALRHQCGRGPGSTAAGSTHLGTRQTQGECARASEASAAAGRRSFRSSQTCHAFLSIAGQAHAGDSWRDRAKSAPWIDRQVQGRTAIGAGEFTGRDERKFRSLAGEPAGLEFSLSPDGPGARDTCSRGVVAIVDSAHDRAARECSTAESSPRRLVSAARRFRRSAWSNYSG
jgi:hypothetical protein